MKATVARGTGVGSLSTKGRQRAEWEDRLDAADVAVQCAQERLDRAYERERQVIEAYERWKELAP